MKKVKITVVRKTEYKDLMEIYENPIKNACNLTIGQQFIVIDGKKPIGLCDSAWETMQKFVI